MGTDEQVLTRIQGLAVGENLRVTVHANVEMLDENISLDDVLDAM